MKRVILLVVAAAFASLVVSQGTAVGASSVTCSGLFTGTADNLIVPANGFCSLDGATITHDVTVQDNAVFAAENTTIGHDLDVSKPLAVALGYGAGTPGPVSIGHDATISGSDAPNGIFVDVCDTTVNHDLKITGVVTQQEIEVGDTGEFCNIDPTPGDTIGHDAVITGNTVATSGIGWLDVGNNGVGHNLVVSGNSAPAASHIDVSDNTVGHDATCAANTPPLSKDGPDDGPNTTGHNNTCG